MIDDMIKSAIAKEAQRRTSTLQRDLEVAVWKAITHDAGPSNSEALTDDINNAILRILGDCQEGIGKVSDELVKNRIWRLIVSSKDAG